MRGVSQRNGSREVPASLPSETPAPLEEKECRRDLDRCSLPFSAHRCRHRRRDRIARSAGDRVRRSCSGLSRSRGRTNLRSLGRRRRLLPRPRRRLRAGRRGLDAAWPGRARAEQRAVGRGRSERRHVPAPGRRQLGDLRRLLHRRRAPLDALLRRRRGVEHAERRCRHRRAGRLGALRPPRDRERLGRLGTERRRADGRQRARRRAAATRSTSACASPRTAPARGRSTTSTSTPSIRG